MNNFVNIPEKHTTCYKLAEIDIETGP